MHATKQRIASRNTFGLETNAFIDSKCASVFRKHTEPNPVSIRVSENNVYKSSQKHLSNAEARARNGHPLYVNDAFGRGPVSNDRETDKFRFEMCYEVGVTSVRKRSPMLCVIPAADKRVIPRETFGRHDEGDILVRGSDQL